MCTFILYVLFFCHTSSSFFSLFFFQPFLLYFFLSFFLSFFFIAVIITVVVLFSLLPSLNCSCSYFESVILTKTKPLSQTRAVLLQSTTPTTPILTCRTPSLESRLFDQSFPETRSCRYTSAALPPKRGNLDSIQMCARYPNLKKREAGC